MLKLARLGAFALASYLLTISPALTATQIPWTKLPGGAVDIAVGANGTAFVTGADAQSVYKWNSRRRTWNRFSGGLARIAVDPRGNPWGVNKGKQIWRHDGRKWHSVPGGATDIVVGANGAVWIIGANKQPGGYDIWRYKGNNAWQRIPGGALRIAVDPRGVPWVINSTNTIFRYNGRSWQTMPGRAKDIGIGANGVVWVVGTNNSPYRWNGRTWIQHTGGLNNITVDPRGYIWGTNAGKQIWADKRSLSLTRPPIAVADRKKLRPKKPTGLKPGPGPSRTSGSPPNKSLLDAGRSLANKFPVLKSLWNTWERAFRQEGVLLKATVRVFNQTATVVIYRPHGKQKPNLAILVNNLRVSNLIKPAGGTPADDLIVTNAAYIFAPNGNAEATFVGTLPLIVRQQVAKVRTGPIEIVAGQNLFSTINTNDNGTTAKLLKLIGVRLGDLKVHIAYGRKKFKKKTEPYKSVRLTRAGTWNKPFHLKNTSMTNATFELVKIGNVKTIRGWGTATLKKKSYFMFLQKKGSKGPWPTAAALDARSVTLKDYKDVALVVGETVFGGLKPVQTILKGIDKVPLDKVRIENPKFKSGGALDKDNNPVFTNVLIMAAAPGDKLPDTPSTVGPIILAHGKAKLFGRTVASVNGWITKSKGMDVRTKVTLPKWGPMNLGDFKFNLYRSGSKYAMELKGKATVPGVFDDNITIKANNSGFSFKLASHCPRRPLGISASVKGYGIGHGSGFKITTSGNPMRCVADIGGAIKNAAGTVANVSQHAYNESKKKVEEELKKNRQTGEEGGQVRRQ